MPIFEYRCKQCGHHMEVFVKSCGKELSQVACEKCGCKNTEKVITGFSVGQRKTLPESGSTCCLSGTCGLS